MSERLETLKKARERMIEDRDAHAKVLAAPFVRDTAERARNKFIEIQALIDALDRAIRGEIPVAVKTKAVGSETSGAPLPLPHCCLAHSTMAVASAPARVSQAVIAPVAAFRSSVTRDAGAGSAIWTPLSRMRA